MSRTSNLPLRSAVRMFAAGACVASVIMATAFSAPAQSYTSGGPGDRELARQLVSATISSYTSYTRGQFTDGVSGDFPTDKYAFVNRVERRFYRARPAQFDFFVNTVNRTGDKIAVSFKWEKKSMVRSTGLQRKNQGQCMFVYRNEGGQWRLYDIKGRSPF